MALTPYPQPIPSCQFAETQQHALGVFCRQCKAIAMPWGTKLPWALDASGFPIADPTGGTILEGLYLHASGVVAVTVLAYCRVNDHDFGLYDNISNRLSEPRLQTIATRILEVADFLQRIKTAKPKPKWYQVLADALGEPNITVVQYIRKIMGGSATEMLNSDHSNWSCEMDDPNPDDTEDEDDHQIGCHKGDESKTSGSLSPVESSIFVSDDYEQIAKLQGSSRGGYKEYGLLSTSEQWEFVHGTDLTDAILYSHDPSKFFLVRQKVGSPHQKDIFHYPKWETFNWDNPENIKHLNEARHRVRSGTQSFSSTSNESTPALKSTPTLKLMSAPKPTAASKVTQKYKNISALRTAVPVRGKKRKMEEMAHSDNDGGSILDEDAQEVRKMVPPFSASQDLARRNVLGPVLRLV